MVEFKTASVGITRTMVFLQRPMSLTLLIIVLVILVLPRLLKSRSRTLA